jgi:hypothetical protein
MQSAKISVELCFLKIDACGHNEQPCLRAQKVVGRPKDSECKKVNSSHRGGVGRVTRFVSCTRCSRFCGNGKQDCLAGFPCCIHSKGTTSVVGPWLQTWPHCCVLHLRGLCVSSFVLTVHANGGALVIICLLQVACWSLSDAAKHTMLSKKTKIFNNFLNDSCHETKGNAS